MFPHPLKIINPVLLKGRDSNTRGTTLFPRIIEALFQGYPETANPEGHATMPSSLVTVDGTGQVYFKLNQSSRPFVGERGCFGWQLRRDFQRVERVCSHCFRLAGRYGRSYSSPSTPLHGKVYHFICQESNGLY